jgi:molybdate transport system permease protein
MKRASDSWFRRVTLGVLLAFCAGIALLFLADLTYVDRASVLAAVQSSAVRHALWLTLGCSLAATLLCVLVAVPAGYALSRQSFRGMMLLDVMVDALIVLPVLIIGISILVVFRQGTDLMLPGHRMLVAAGMRLTDAETGLLGSIAWGAVAWAGYLLWLVGQAFALLGRLFVYQIPGIVLAMFFCAASYGVRVMKATFDEMDPRTEEVARTLGCSRGGAFFRVSLPLARHGIIAAAVLSWARAVGIYGPVMIVAGAVEGRTQVLPTTIFLEISVGNLELALAISLLMILMAFIVLIALRVFSGSNLFGGAAR